MLSDMKKYVITIALLASALAAQAKTSTPAGWTDDNVGGSKVDIYGVRYRKVK